MKVIDLCCGAGGFSEGFKQAGFKIILGVDTDFLACNSFRLNHHCNVWQRDIREIFSLPDADVIIGSPPCQHFSKANRNFKKEPDLSIIDAFLRIVKQQQPEWWVMENVPEIIDFIKPLLHKYFSEEHINIQILQANWFGLYHKRARVFVGKFPAVAPRKIVDIIYPTPIASDDHRHKSKNNPNVACLSDYFGFTPEIDVFKRIMGFPDNYIFVGKKKEQIKQIGNAVCPPVAKAIAETILLFEKPIQMEEIP